MKKILITACALLVAGSTMAGIVAYWEGESTTSATWYETNVVTATSFKDGVTTDITGYGSNDGTYGTLAGANTATVGGLKAKNGNTLRVKVTNVSGADLVLDTLNFDFAQAFANSPTNITVVYFNGNLTGVSSNDTIVAYNSTVQPGGASDYEDIDVSLSSVLSDVTLADTEFVTFEFQFSGGATANAAAGLDNIAIQATVIPEPATLGLMGSFGLAMVYLRRKFSA